MHIQIYVTYRLKGSYLNGTHLSVADQENITYRHNNNTKPDIILVHFFVLLFSVRTVRLSVGFRVITVSIVCTYEIF